MKEVTLRFWGLVRELKNNKLLLEGEPVILPYPSPGEGFDDWVAIFEIKEVSE